MSQPILNLDEFVQERKWYAQSGVKYVKQNKIKAPETNLKTYREIFQNYLEAKKAELFHATKGSVNFFIYFRLDFFNRKYMFKNEVKLPAPYLMFENFCKFSRHRPSRKMFLNI